MKRYIFLLFSLSILLGGRGETRVTAEEAKRVASDYYQLVTKETSGNTLVGSPETFSLLGLADMWLVPINDSWILVSTDKRTEAILARFKTQERPNLKSYPPAAQYLISCYEHDIAFVRDSCEKCPVKECWEQQPKKMTSQAKQTKSYPSSVEPLLGDLGWAQYGNESFAPSCDKVYNKYCPQINTTDTTLCEHAVVGCAAVAVAQIMWYWKWPYIASIPTTVGGSTKEIHFFDWEMMPLWLSNSSSLAEVNATASFLRDIGYDMGMNYGESSGVLDQAAVNTLKNLGFASTVKLYQKWATPGWTDSLHSEIGAGRPVYYGGYGNAIWQDGHSFVLDGYDAGQLYHANIGWGTTYNDYYYIDTITVSGSQFSYWQSAIWGIQPDPTNFCAAATIPSIQSMFSTYGIARAGAISLDGVVLNSNANWRVYSSTSISLLPGTEVRKGATAVFAIKDVPCSSSPSSMPASKEDLTVMTDAQNHEKGGSLSVAPNPATDILQVHYEGILQEISIYNLNGILVLKSSVPIINISHLPEGIYIVHATTSEGQILQTKFIRRSL